MGWAQLTIKNLLRPIWRVDINISIHSSIDNYLSILVLTATHTSASSLDQPSRLGWSREDVKVWAAAQRQQQLGELPRLFTNTEHATINKWARTSWSAPKIITATHPIDKIPSPQHYKYPCLHIFTWTIVPSALAVAPADENWPPSVCLTVSISPCSLRS